jgi:hypothetical protein
MELNSGKPRLVGGELYIYPNKEEGNEETDSVFVNNDGNVVFIYRWLQ